MTPLSLRHRDQGRRHDQADRSRHDRPHAQVGDVHREDGTRRSRSTCSRASANAPGFDETLGKFQLVGSRRRRAACRRSSRSTSTPTASSLGLGQGPRQRRQQKIRSTARAPAWPDEEIEAHGQGHRGARRRRQALRRAGRRRAARRRYYWVRSAAARHGDEVDGNIKTTSRNRDRAAHVARGRRRRADPDARPGAPRGSPSSPRSSTPETRREQRLPRRVAAPPPSDEAEEEESSRTPRSCNKANRRNGDVHDGM